MRRIDRLHLEHPFAGARMLRDLLSQDGFTVGRKHVATLMCKMGIEAIYRKPNTSRRHPRHPVHPYLLRGLTITRPNQVWAMDITYIPMARGHVYLRHLRTARLYCPAGSAGAETAGQPDPFPRRVCTQQQTPRAGDTGQTGQGR